MLSPPKPHQIIGKKLPDGRVVDEALAEEIIAADRAHRERVPYAWGDGSGRVVNMSEAATNFENPQPAPGTPEPEADKPKRRGRPRKDPEPASAGEGDPD